MFLIQQWELGKNDIIEVFHESTWKELDPASTPISLGRGDLTILFIRCRRRTTATTEDKD